MGALSRSAAGREALLTEVERNFDALAALLPPLHASLLPLAFDRGCDAAFADRVRKAFEPRFDKHPEMRRTATQAVELIRICAAERESASGVAAAFFERR